MTKRKKQDSIIFAFIAVFFAIIGFFVVFLAKREDKYVMFYAKQSLVIFILFVIAALADSIPVIGFIIGPLLIIISIIIWAIAWINALSGEMRDTFLISEVSNKIKL